MFKSFISLLFPTKRPKSFRNSLLSELSSVKQHVREEIEEFDFAGLSLRDKGKRLLYLFQGDLLPGLRGQILCAKGKRDNSATKPVSLTAKVLGYVVVFLSNAGMLFYIFLFALVQSKSRQDAWLQSFLLWLMCEVLIVSTVVVLVVHYFIPSFIQRDVEKIGEKLQQSVIAYHESLAANRHDDGAIIASTYADDRDDNFNAAEFLFVSSQVAKRFPDLPVSKVIRQFHTPWPRRSYERVHDASQSYKNNGVAFLLGGFATILLYMLESFVQLPQGFQDGLVRSTAALGTGYMVLLHAQLFNFYPALAFLPIFLVFVFSHICLQSSINKTDDDRGESGKVLPILHDKKELEHKTDDKELVTNEIDNSSYNHVNRRISNNSGCSDDGNNFEDEDDDDELDSYYLSTATSDRREVNSVESSSSSADEVDSMDSDMFNSIVDSSENNEDV